MIIIIRDKIPPNRVLYYG